MERIGIRSREGHVTTTFDSALVGAGILYMVRSWVDPEKGQPYLDWLETKHMVEVCAEPGFLWARKVELDQKDCSGWNGYLLLYGLADREALDAYLKSPARQRFWKELEAFEEIHYSERFYGKADFAV
jgi:antibiotic biosynthesis monooxygenase (ABM) superfamily enzyme